MNKYNKFVGLFNEFYDINDIKIDEKLKYKGALRWGYLTYLIKTKVK